VPDPDFPVAETRARSGCAGGHARGNRTRMRDHFSAAAHRARSSG
jgi:hypothetical protein